MTKVCVEVSIISAHGLLISPSRLMKPQWFAVAWIDPNNKYCTKIDRSDCSSPAWKSKFSVVVDKAGFNIQGMSLTVEVYRMEPIFLREKLQGSTTIHLKEFFDKFAYDEAASFQLRGRKSGKAKGFVDISVRIFEVGDSGATFYSGSEGGYRFSDHKDDIELTIEDRPVMTYPTQRQLPLKDKSWLGPYPYRSRSPPIPENYVNLPPTVNPGIGMELGAGALAAGAMIFGDNFLSDSSSVDPPKPFSDRF